MGFEWTLDELVARVSAALEAADYPGAPNGRVREVPDRRAIRWYTTIGLLDRPDGMRPLEDDRARALRLGVF